ncbi:uncharacterized protein [Rutidosis leptorrhynchoides]|uniref:uncharacterized protein n=1 Tax=Rutidosis leptorrhynchoides TaxID=125765 RepID=UPI003A99E7DE
MAKGRAFQITTKEAREDPELVTGTFLLDNHLASILFDTGSDKSFIAKDFSVAINRPLTALDTRYAVELANDKLIKVDKIMRGCALNLSNNLFEVDLMPVELGSFDVVIGMDWLSKNRADINCAEKSIRIPLDNGENLVIQGDKSKVNLNIISCMRARRYLKKGYPSILAHVKELKTKEVGLEDVPVVREFPQVFPEDLPGLRPHRQVEFHIDLVPGAAPIAKSPYRLAPSELQELSNQLQELLDKGFIRPSAQNGSADSKLCRLKTDADSKLCSLISRKERVKPLRVRSLNITIQTNLVSRIQNAQMEAMKEENVKKEGISEKDKNFEAKSDGTRYFENRIWIPKFGGLRELVMDEEHKTRYLIHPGSGKMYHDLKEFYWWPNMKAEIATYVRKCLTYLKTAKGYDTSWVIVVRLMKSAHFLPMKETDKIERLADLYIKEIVSRHGVPISIISDQDCRFTSRFWQSLQKALSSLLYMSTAYQPQTDGQSERTILTFKDMLRACVIDFGSGWDQYLPLAEFLYNNSYHSNIKAAPFEALYGRKCRSPLFWSEIGDSQLTGS